MAQPNNHLRPSRNGACCDWGWVEVTPGTTPTVRPCEVHLAATHDRWASGAYVLLWHYYDRLHDAA